MIARVKLSMPISLLLFLLLSAASQAENATPVVAYRSEPGVAFDRIIDTRTADLCRKNSLAGARCLPPEDVLGPYRRMPNVSGLLWLLGSAGLRGDEHVLVVGDDRNRRDFIAGLLYLAGQKRVLVLNTRITGRTEYQTGAGSLRSRIRETVFVAPMRAERIVLRNELKALIAGETPPVLLDGRSEEEYWGADVRGTRGGHLPGAQHFPSDSIRRAAAGEIEFPRQSGDPIAYAHDGYEGLAYLARLAANGIESRLYLEGWSGWASDGTLPVDSASYPEPVVASENNSRQIPSEKLSEGGSSAAIVAAGGSFALLGFFLGRLTKNRGTG